MIRLRRVISICMLVIVLFSSDGVIFPSNLTALASTTEQELNDRLGLEDDGLVSREELSGPIVYSTDMGSLDMPVIDYDSELIQNIDGDDIYSSDNASEDNLYDQSFDYLQDIVQEIRDASGATGITKLIVTALNYIIVFIADTLLLLLNDVGLNIDRIIYGRVGVGDGQYSITTFALDEGNFFGNIAQEFYKMTTFFAASLIPILFIGSLAMFVFVSRNAAKRAEVLNAIKYVFVILFLIILAPQIVYLMLYVRDIILLLTMRLGLSMSDGNGTGSIISTMRDATRGGGIVDAGIYLGLVILTIYYAFVYTGIAIALTIEFILIPLVILLATNPKNRGILMDTVKQIVSNISFPVIDALLLSIVMYALFMNLPSFIVVLLMFSMIPGRKVIQNRLAIASKGGLDVASVGAMFGAIALARGAVSATRSVASNVATGAKGYSSDMANASWEDEIASSGATGGVGADGATRRPASPILSSSGEAGASTATPTSRSTATTSPSAYTYRKVARPGMSNKVPSTASSVSQAPSTSVATPNQKQDEPQVSQGYIRDNADTSWLDDPKKMRALSPAQRADLYRKRAKHTLKRSLTKSGISAGSSIVGGLTLGSAGAWLGPQGAAYGASAGLAMGSVTDELYEFGADMKGNPKLETINDQFGDIISQVFNDDEAMHIIHAENANNVAKEIGNKTVSAHDNVRERFTEQGKSIDTEQFDKEVQKERKKLEKQIHKKHNTNAANEVASRAESIAKDGYNFNQHQMDALKERARKEFLKGIKDVGMN